MDKQQVLELLKEYKAGTISAENRLLLENWYHQQALQNRDELTADQLENSIELLRGRLLLNVTRNPALPLYGNRKLITALSLAASIIFVIATGTYFFLFDGKKQQNTAYTRGITAPKNTAVLTLSNGKQIDLDSAGKGVIAKQGSNDISKKADGALTYQSPAAAGDLKDNGAVIYNTITTPKGGKFELVLSDGTRVIINAHSTLTYPASFASLKERRVLLMGEAYFEVAHIKSAPFRVISGKHTVEVLGTHFNVMAYPDEKTIATTLIQGSVKVSLPGAVKIIKPGEQARATANVLQIDEQVDTDDVLAWKNGYFIFNDDDLETIMRKVSRWYDVDLVYDQAGSVLKTSRFGGIVSRTRNLSEVLNTMEKTGKVKFKINGRQITITK